MEFELIINKTKYRIQIDDQSNNVKKVKVNDEEHYVTLDARTKVKTGLRKAKIGELDYNLELIKHTQELGRAEFEMKVNEKRAELKALLPHVHNREFLQDSSNNIAAEAISEKNAAKKPKKKDGAKERSAGVKEEGGVYAPMPGRLMSLKVKVGDSVKTGQVVAILEAMKMENELKSMFTGSVKQINYKQGDNVSQDKPIMIID